MGGGAGSTQADRRGVRGPDGQWGAPGKSERPCARRQGRGMTQGTTSPLVPRTLRTALGDASSPLALGGAPVPSRSLVGGGTLTEPSPHRGGGSFSPLNQKPFYYQELGPHYPQAYEITTTGTVCQNRKEIVQAVGSATRSSGNIPLPRVHPFRGPPILVRCQDTDALGELRESTPHALRLLPAQGPPSPGSSLLTTRRPAASRSRCPWHIASATPALQSVPSRRLGPSHLLLSATAPLPLVLHGWPSLSCPKGQARHSRGCDSPWDSQARSKDCGTEPPAGRQDGQG